MLVSSINFLQNLRRFRSSSTAHAAALRDIQSQTLALSTLTLSLVSGGVDLAVIDKELLLPLVRCGEQCAKRRDDLATMNAERRWTLLLRDANHIIRVYMSTFMVGLAERMLYVRP